MVVKVLCTSAILAAAGACASGSGGSAGASPTPSQAVEEPRPLVTRNRDVISQQELAADPSLRAQSVMDVIRTLRPQFLTDRGSNTIGVSGMSDPEAGKVHVSVDNGRVVSLSELSSMHANEVIEIRFLNVAQAMQKFGTAARQGPVIVVITNAK